MRISTGPRSPELAERRRRFRWLPVVVVAFLTLPATTTAGELSGYVALEGRQFAESADHQAQSDDAALSLVLEPEYYWQSESGGSDVEVQLFARLDSVDSERTHFDVRELYWRRSRRSWELLLGVSKVFWGVTESQHLVDIVNQTDLVENPDGEDKLGQPMARLSLIRDWGIVDLFVLPGFRERTFPGVEGRLRAPLPISDDPLYESSAEEGHVDFAVRWSHAVGPFDLGLSHFTGTTREPRLLGPAEVAGLPSQDSSSPGSSSELVPFYEQIDQTGLDVQATTGSFLWKLEAISRSGQLDRFAATTAGFEYTFWGVFGSSVDVGALSEYLWDERGDLGGAAFQDDLFVGTRIALNDAKDTEILAGTIADLENDGQLFLVEASRRIGSSWVVEAELRAFSGSSPTDPLAALRADDYFQLSLQRHF